jgi:hypothetical protein
LESLKRRLSANKSTKHDCSQHCLPLVKSPSNQVEGEGMSVAVKLGSYKHVYNKLLVTANEFKSLVGFESFMVKQSWLGI